MFLMYRLLLIAGSLLAATELVDSDEECAVTEKYCPDVGCVSVVYACNGCLWQQVKCPDGSCIFSYESCDKPPEKHESGCTPGQKACKDGVCVHVTQHCNDCPADMKKCPDGNCINFLNSCTSPCKVYEMACDDGRCVTLGKLCNMDHSGCTEYQKACPDGRCISWLLTCDFIKDYDHRMCASYQYECKDGRCMSYASDCFEDNAKGFYYYVTIPIIMVSLALSLTCRHCKKEARNARLATYAAASANNASQLQPAFSRPRMQQQRQQQNMQQTVIVIPSTDNNNHAAAGGVEAAVYRGPDPPAYPMVVAAAAAPICAPSYSEACLTAPTAAGSTEHRRPEVLVLRELGADDGENSTSQERLLPQPSGHAYDPPPPYPGAAERHIPSDLSPPPSYDEVTK